MTVPPSSLSSALPLATAPADVAWFPLLVGLLGGLALFLYGLQELSRALRAVAGDRMRRLLARLTGNRWVGALAGAFVTAVIQSSSVTTVLVVGFVSAGLMTLTQSVGVIMGANVGTTVTAQIIALKVTQYALLLIAIGFVHGVRRQAGAACVSAGFTLLGLGLVFLGHEPHERRGDAAQELPALSRLHGAAGAPRAGHPRRRAVHGPRPVLVGDDGRGDRARFPGVDPAHGGHRHHPRGERRDLHHGGARRHSGQSRDAQRAALVHVLFNVLGVLVWLPLLPHLADLVPSLSGTLPDEVATPRRIANAHTIFNVANTILFLPFAGVFARVVTRVLPDRPAAKGKVLRARYLDENLLATPSLALDRVRQEILRLAGRVKGMFVDVLPAMVDGTRQDLARLAARDDEVDFLHGAIVSYLAQVSRGRLTEDQTTDLVHLLEIVSDLENVGDIIETNLVSLGQHRLDKGVRISPATRAVLEAFHAEILHALDAAELAVTQENVEAAAVVRGMKPAINRMADAAARHGVDRLVADEPHRLAAYAIERDMVENLKRVYYFATRMARAIVPGE